MEGLHLKAYEPLIRAGYLYSRSDVDDLTNRHAGYTHSITAEGGYDTAGFTLLGDLAYLDDWFEDGLARHIEYTNPQGLTSWRGLVTTLRLNNAGLQKTKTLDSMYNQVQLSYTPMDWSVFPPIPGPTHLLVMNDPDSQVLYGAKAAIIAGGEAEPSEAFTWAENVLTNRRLPQVGEAVSLSDSSLPTLEVECRGYYHCLKWLPFYSTRPGSLQSGQVIQAVLTYFGAANPGLISPDYSWMSYNFRGYRAAATEQTSCWDVILNVMHAGGLGGERWVGGVYQDGRMIYKPAEDISGLYGDHADLRRALGDNAQAIYDVEDGNQVFGWDLLPDRILLTTDLWHDNRMYIEAVTWNETTGQVNLTGNDDQRLSVFLAQRGLPSI